MSARTSQPVLGEVLARLPYTFELALVAIVLATIVGIVAGVIAATHHNTLTDYLASAFSLFGVSMPVYWLGLMLIVIFAINLKMLPAAGADQPISFVLPGAHAGPLRRGADRAYDALEHAGGAAPGLRADGAGQGPDRARGRLRSRACATPCCR